MKKIIFLLLYLLFISRAFSQDNDAVAKTYYINAEEYFNKGSLGGYDSCVAELEKAEKALGTTNPKILYLKIKAMSQSVLPYHDPYYAYNLNKSLKKFFQMTDSKNYPADKYSEIVNLNEGFVGAFKNSEILEDSTYRNSDSSLNYRGLRYKVKSYLYKRNDLWQFAERCFIESANNDNNKKNVKAMSHLVFLYCEKTIQLEKEDYYKYATDIIETSSKAEYWCNKAAEKGQFKACAEIGSMFFIYLRDDKKAFKYLSLASEKNIVEAWYWLGFMYYDQRDYKQAMEYFLKAANAPKDLRTSSAMNQISYMYDNGKGVKKDKSLAREWAQKADAAKN